MFHHLFHNSPAWLLVVLTAGLVLHVGSGGIAILSGTGALIARKGGRLHRWFGTIFFIAMLCMATAASSLAVVAVTRGYPEQIGNIFGGLFAFYLVSTGWLTVRRPPGVVGVAEIGGCMAVVVIALITLTVLLPIALGPHGAALGVPVAAPAILAAMAGLLGALDLKVILRGGVSGVSRTLRHLWRMCLGMFIATGSFFIGQQADMPAAIRGSPVLLVLGVAPVIAMVFWLIRTRRPAKQASAPALAVPALVSDL